MSALSDYAEKLVIDWMLTAGSATRPTSWTVALYTAAPSDAGGGTEVSGAGYARQAVTFSAGSSPGGTTSNSGTVSFTASGGNFGTVTHIGIFDDGGNLLIHGALTASRTINDGDTLTFDAASIAMTLG